MTFLVCLVFFIVKKHAPSFHFGGEGRSLSSRILGVGLSPFGLTYSPNITLILLNKSAVIFGGTIAVTCYAPISYISSVVMLLMQGVSDGSQPLISLAYGEGKYHITKTVRNLAYRFAFGVAAIALSSFSFCGATRHIYLGPLKQWRYALRKFCRSS